MVDLIALKKRLNVLAVRLLCVNVNADQNLVGQGLKGPPHEGLKHLAGHVDLSQIARPLLV